MAAEGFTAIKFDVDVANPWKMDVYDRSISRREHEHIIDAASRPRARPSAPMSTWPSTCTARSTWPTPCASARTWSTWTCSGWRIPIRWEWGNVDAMRKICMQTETPICTGEIFYGAKPHRDLIESGACDMLEPDIPRSGGAIEIRRIAELAEMHYMSIAPHNMTSTITAIAAAHICARSPTSWRSSTTRTTSRSGARCSTSGTRSRHGYITVPDGPGLGIELDEDEIRAAHSGGARRFGADRRRSMRSPPGPHRVGR